MARLSAALFVALATICQLVHAAPLAKRVSQDMSDSTHEWVQACVRLLKLSSAGVVSSSIEIAEIAAEHEYKQAK